MLSVLGRRPRAAVLACLVVVAVAALVLTQRGGGQSGSLPASTGKYGGVLADPIDPRQFTALPWESRSHWLQPWRAYLDTVPASRLLGAIGINFNVDPSQADGTARLLAANGFKRARVEVSWDHLDFDDPTKLADNRASVLLGALKRHGIRPLILLNANQGAPGPIRPLDVNVTQAAPQGARELVLDKASVAQVVPGHTGLNATSGPPKAAAVIFTAASPDGKVQLSKPLPQALAPGTYHASTLKYEPFGPPTLSDGKPNPKFGQTMAGWLQYVSTVTHLAKTIMGGENFDVEVWNELSFGSGFLNQANYYDPPRETGSGDATQELLARTVAWIRDPANGVSQIGISDGFASQTPFPAGSTEPPGLTAMSKHPYKGLQRFPKAALYNGTKPVDALGKPSFHTVGGEKRDDFVPIYDALFPEYFLSAIQTETMVRDLAPWTNKITGVVHGRGAHPPGSAPPQVWLTEAGIDPSGADPSIPGNSGLPHLSDADVLRLHAKSVLRMLVAFVNKGVGAVYPYGVEGGNLALVDPNFMSALAKGYPGDHAGGPVMDAVGRLVAAFDGSVPNPRVQPLSLLRIAQEGNHAQFKGDGTPAHPTLFDRDVLAFFPFEVRPGRYVVPVYVMTRDLLEPLGQENFELTIGGVPQHAKVSATDPLTGTGVPVRVVSQSGSRLEVRMPVTDSPRLLAIQQG